MTLPTLHPEQYDNLRDHHQRRARLVVLTPGEYASARGLIQYLRLCVPQGRLQDLPVADGAALTLRVSHCPLDVIRESVYYLEDVIRNRVGHAVRSGSTSWNAYGPHKHLALKIRTNVGYVAPVPTLEELDRTAVAHRPIYDAP